MQQQNNGKTTTQNELTTRSVFSLRNDNKRNLCLYNKNAQYFPNEKITVSDFEFSKRLINKIGKFIDNDFDWSNVLISGGLISGMIDSKFNAATYKDSDIDVFIYGINNQSVSNKIQEIYNYFVTKFDRNFYSFVYTPNTPIINIIIPGECSFQIIGTNFKTKMEVLQSFDMTHCQIGYDDTGIVYTVEFLNAIKTRVTAITTNSIHAYRLLKAYYRGYSIANPEYCYIKNIFHEYTTKPGDDFPSNSDAFYDIHNLENIVHILEVNEIVQKNLNKNYIPPKHQTYSKEAMKKEMENIGMLYAGKDRYMFVNDCDIDIFFQDITEFLEFVRMPFLC